MYARVMRRPLLLYYRPTAAYCSPQLILPLRRTTTAAALLLSLSLSLIGKGTKRKKKRRAAMRDTTPSWAGDTLRRSYAGLPIAASAWATACHASANPREQRPMAAVQGEKRPGRIRPGVGAAVAPPTADSIVRAAGPPLAASWRGEARRGVAWHGQAWRAWYGGHGMEGMASRLGDALLWHGMAWHGME